MRGGNTVGHPTLRHDGSPASRCHTPSAWHAGSAAFNGVHLRIEKDAGTWAQILGGRHVVEARYRVAMRAASFDAKTPLYIASALLTYQGGVEELDQVDSNNIIWEGNHALGKMECNSTNLRGAARIQKICWAGHRACTRKAPDSPPG